MKNLLGGKGANLAEMTRLGIPVPQDLLLLLKLVINIMKMVKKFHDEIIEQIYDNITKLEEITGKKFGDNTNPLLVSVRSGARVSMPGMMDTILNLRIK